MQANHNPCLLIQLQLKVFTGKALFQKSQDPTLTFVWDAMYAWDEALENLYEHIYSLVSCVSSCVRFRRYENSLQHWVL